MHIMHIMTTCTSIKRHVFPLLLYKYSKYWPGRHYHKQTRAYFKLNSESKAWGVLELFFDGVSGGTRIFFLGGGHRGGKMRFWGAKIKKFAENG